MGELRGMICFVRKGGREIALGINTGVAFASFALFTPSTVVTILSVAQEGHSTSLVCRSALEVSFIGMAGLFSPKSPKCSSTLLRISPPTVEI